MYKTFTVRAFGDYFMINCNTCQEYYSVKNVLDREWLWYREEELDFPCYHMSEINAKDLLKDC